MNHEEINAAIKHDLNVIPQLTFGQVTAKEFYSPLIGMLLRMSLMLLCANLACRLILRITSLHAAPFTPTSIIVNWIFALCVSLFFMLPFSKLVLYSKLLKGRLQTEALLKEKCKQAKNTFFIIYSVAYMIFTLLTISGMEEHASDLLTFTLGFAQACSFLIGSAITGIMFNTELERLGLGILFNCISDGMQAARERFDKRFDGDAK